MCYYSYKKIMCTKLSNVVLWRFFKQQRNYGNKQKRSQILKCTKHLVFIWRKLDQHIIAWLCQVFWNPWTQNLQLKIYTQASFSISLQERTLLFCTFHIFNIKRKFTPYNDIVLGLITFEDPVQCPYSVQNNHTSW